MTQLRRFRLTAPTADAVLATIEVDGEQLRDVRKAVVTFEVDQPIRVELEHLAAVDVDAPALVTAHPQPALDVQIRALRESRERDRHAIVSVRHALSIIDALLAQRSAESDR